MSKSRSGIGPLINEQNNLTSDSKEMSNILAEQYAKVFSTPITNVTSNTVFQEEKPYRKLSITEEDLIKAIMNYLLQQQQALTIFLLFS